MNNIKKLQPPNLEMDFHGAHSANMLAAARYTEAMREEISSMHAKITDLEGENIRLESEVECLKIQLEGERNERRHYHQYAASITTSLSNVTKIIDDVLAQAVTSARSPAEGMPDIDMPARLQAHLNRPHEANGKDAA